MSARRRDRARDGADAGARGGRGRAGGTRGRASALDGLLAVAAAAALAVTLLAVGLGACCLRPTTQLLSQHTSAFDLAPYTPEQLTELAVSTRDFTVDDYGREAFGEEGAQVRLAQIILRAADDASAADSPVADRWSGAARRVLAQGHESDPSPDVTLSNLADVSQNYTLDDEALSHLEDCNRLFASVAPLLWAAAALAAACAVALAVRRQTRLIGIALTVAPAVLTAAMAVLGAWAVVDFDGLFAAFHSLFFEAGTWTFYYDSLLICMYPLAFWMGMAAVWLATSVAFSILSLMLGRRLRRA